MAWVLRQQAAHGGRRIVLPLDHVIRLLMVVTVAGYALLACAAAEEPPARQSIPFVAAFDRFGRHGDIRRDSAAQLLLTELSCTACHLTTDPGLSPRRGPSLDNAGDRLNSDWVVRYLTSPARTDPGTVMPELPAEPDATVRQTQVRQLTAFLSSRRVGFRDPRATGTSPVPHEFWKHGDPEHGRQLYHQVGCVACHAPDPEFDVVAPRRSQQDELLEQLEPDELAESGLTSAARPVSAVPLGHVAEKYTRRGLTDFLLDPTAIRPDGRMPHLKLSAMEAADVAAWLIEFTAPATRESPAETIPSSASPDDVAAGHQLFTVLRCNGCHAIRGISPSVAAPQLALLNTSSSRSCLGDPVADLPHFPVDAIQAELIRETLRSVSEERGTADTASDMGKASQPMLQFNCLACHRRSGLGGVGRNVQMYFATVRHADLGDEGRLPPDLSHAGARLRPDWLQKVLAGTGTVRPFLLARMPAYPEDVARHLTEVLVASDQSSLPVLPEPMQAGSAPEAGRLLFDFGCVQCHGIRGESLPGVIGVDLTGIQNRVQPAWFDAFLRNPIALRERTRMPSFFPNGRSANPQILHGDVSQQVGALWNYLQAAERLELPGKIIDAQSQSFELRPADRPVILRTFMKSAGTHAIAVGFPGQINLAYDSLTAQPAIAWKGRFLDARSTWFDRFAAPADPLGDHSVSFPAAPAFVAGQFVRDNISGQVTSEQDAVDVRSGGYRLDGAGVPEFLLTIRHGGLTLRLQDRFEPLADGRGLQRRLHFQPARASGTDTAAPVMFQAAQGPFTIGSGGDCQLESGLQIVLSGSMAAAAVVTGEGHDAAWVIPVDGTHDGLLEVQYRW